jgi:hypothetical protein
MNWMAEESWFDFWQREEIFLFIISSVALGSTRVQSSGFLGLFPGQQSDRIVKLTIHLYQMLRLMMSRAIPFHGMVLNLLRTRTTLLYYL